MLFRSRIGVAVDGQMELVVLKDFGKVIEVTSKGHERKAGQVFKLKHVAVKGRQQFAALHKGIVLFCLKGFDKAEANMHSIKKAFQRFKVPDGAMKVWCKGRAPVKGVLREYVLPGYHETTFRREKSLRRKAMLPTVKRGVVFWLRYQTMIPRGRFGCAADVPCSTGSICVQKRESLGESAHPLSGAPHFL